MNFEVCLRQEIFASEVVPCSSPAAGKRREFPTLYQHKHPLLWENVRLPYTFGPVACIGPGNEAHFDSQDRKHSLSLRMHKKEISFRPESFVLCERSSGGCTISSAGGAGWRHAGSSKVAGLLAMALPGCAARRRMYDFEVMVVARESLLQTVSERAEQLLCRWTRPLAPA